MVTTVPAQEAARLIVANPTIYCDRPHIFLLAWAALLTARGNRMRQTRILPARRPDSAF